MQGEILDDIQPGGVLETYQLTGTSNGQDLCKHLNQSSRNSVPGLQSIRTQIPRDKCCSRKRLDADKECRVTGTEKSTLCGSVAYEQLQRIHPQIEQIA